MEESIQPPQSTLPTPPDQSVVQAPPQSHAPTQQKKNYFIIIILFIVLIGIMIFSPIPYYLRHAVSCKPGVSCPGPGWYFRKSLFQQMKYDLSNKSFQEILSDLSGRPMVGSRRSDNTTLTPTPTPDETANWKTYTGTGIEFKYPSNWKTDSNTNAFKLGDAISVYTTVQYDAKVLFTVATPVQTTLGLRNWIDKENILVPYPGEETPKLSEDTTLGGESTIRINYCVEGCFTFLYAKREDKIYAVAYPSGDWIPENIQKTFDQILSTFKFTNNDITKKCSSDKDCPGNSFCDYSSPGGMGPNGFVSGQPYGSQKCILKCKNNDQCSSGQCQTFEVVGGDISISQKGCKL